MQYDDGEIGIHIIDTPTIENNISYDRIKLIIPTSTSTSTSTTTTSIQQQRQKQLRYTEEENQALIEGHMQFGTNWSETLVMYRDVFHPCRGNASLSNRYHYIVKNESAYFVSV